MSQAYFGYFERLTKAYAPVLNGFSRYNLELTGLATRRARAWYEIPSTLRTCKTPQDLLGEQTRFWQTAMAQYTESWQRQASVLGSMAFMPGFFPGVPAAGIATPGRDIITFPDAPEQAETGADKHADRRAA
jgi:hypothetical protein